MSVKIVEILIEFVIDLVKKAILTGLVGVALAFTLLVFTIFMPEQVKAAFEILKSIAGV